MQLMTSNELIELIKQQDPEGKRLVFLRIYDEMDRSGKDFPVAFGEIDADTLRVSCKDAYATQMGDKDVLCLDLRLDCSE